MTPAARRAGLRPGDPAAEASVLVPQLALLPVDPEGEWLDRAALARAIGTLSERVSFWWEDAIVFEVSCAEAEEHDTAQQAVDCAVELGYTARAAVASDPIAARALAEWLAPPGGAAVFRAIDSALALAPLPLTALRPEGSLSRGLQAQGIETIGDLASLDPARLAALAEHGQEAYRLHQIARGEPPDPIRTEASDPASVRTVLGGATMREIGLVLPGMLAELSEQLADRDLVAVRLRITLELDPSAAATAIVRLDGPSSSVRRLERSIRDRLAVLAPGSPIDGIGIDVIEASPRDRSAEARLRPGSPAASRAPPELCLAGEAWAEGDALRDAQGWLLPRPTWVLSSAPRIEIEALGLAPTWIRIDRRWRDIDRATAPDRPGGWAPPSPDRAYWAVEVGDRGLWVYRDRDGWWLYGLFDAPELTAGISCRPRCR